MRNLPLILISFLFLVEFFILIQTPEPGWELFVLPGIIAGIFIFNMAVRKFAQFRTYFTSKWNILTTKFQREYVYDIPKDLMIDKIAEVIRDSKFKLVEVNTAESSVFAITKTTMKSWGENIYIDLKAAGDQTVLDFCSVTMFQVVSWGKNESNYQRLLADIEEALII